MKIKKIMKKVVKTRSTHTANITVLIAPRKTLLANYCVHRGKFWHIRVIHKLAVLKR